MSLFQDRAQVLADLLSLCFNVAVYQLSGLRDDGDLSGSVQGVVGAALNENGEVVNNNDEGGLENGKSDTSVSPAGLALFSSEGKEAPGGDVVSRMGVADGVNSSHLGVSNEDFYSRRSKNTNIIDKPVREIKEIRVFFSDGTYEAFVPSGK